MPFHSILVVDDDPDTRRVMRQVLEAHGYAVSSTASGREAIRLLNRETVDLVITDMLMSDGDGFELIAALHKYFSNLPVIAISGGGTVDADNCLSIAQGFQADAVLKKPITRDELLKAIKSLETSASVKAQGR